MTGDHPDSIYDDRVVAIIVTYNPVLQALAELLRATSLQVYRIIIVDNGSAREPEIVASCSGIYNCECACLGKNTGIANAINHGIAMARNMKATHIVLFDQDSLPSLDMISILHDTLEGLSNQGDKVAAVGARFVDERTMNPPPFIQLKYLFLFRHTCEHEQVVPVDYLISSGCMITISSLDQIGLMNSKLFIDYVDIEWGLRAKEMGFQLFGVCAAHMKHELGDTPLALLGRRLPLRSPLRHYYMFRNAVWLYRQPWVPLSWKFADGVRLLAKYVVYSIFTKQGMQHLKRMSVGIWHGLIDKMGEFER